MKKHFIVRIISMVLVCLLISYFAVPAFADEEIKVYGWTFDTNNGGFFANASTRSWEDGNLVQTIEGKNNSWLLSPSGLSIDTSVYKYMKIRVKNSTNAAAKDKFSFEATGSEKSAFTGIWSNFGTIPNDGEFHEYTVDMTQSPDWKGIINRFRLRVTEWNCTGNVYIDYIKFESPDPSEETRSITINTPTDPSDIAYGESIVLTSTVDGAVPNKVEYFADGESLGEVAEAPYALEWTPLEKKVYYITAEAIFDDKTIVSKSVYLNVYDSEIIEKSAYYWRFSGVTQGWLGNNITVSATDDCLVGEVEAGKINSFLLSPSGLAIDASEYKYIKVRVKADYGQPGILALQWTTLEDGNFDSSWNQGTKTYEVGKTVVTNDGVFHDYVIDLSSQDGWIGTVTRIRVKVTPGSDLGKMKFTVDSVRVSNTLANGIDEDDIPKPSSIVTFESSEELKSLTVYKGAQYTDEVIKPEFDGTYKLPAGLYTYTAEPMSVSLCKVHQNFYVTEADVDAGNKTITLSHTEWANPGFWQVKTMFVPPAEMTEKYFSDPIPEKELVTPAFEEGRRMNAFTTQEELEAYLDSINETASNMWLTTIGTSDNNLNIPFVIFSEGADNNASWTSLEEAATALRGLGKPIVWVSAQTHGNEVSGGESALQLIYELTTVWGQEVLEDVSVIVLPRQNPKGAMYNRRTPNGSNDINRDRVKLELQETQAISNAYWLFTPEVSIDAHEYGSVPALYQGKYTYGAYDLLISPANNCFVTDEIREKGFTWYADPVKDKLSEYGIRGFDYYDGSLSGGMSENGSFRGTHTTINSFYPSFAFLFETLIPGGGYNSMTHFERRVKSHLISMMTAIEITANNSADVMDLLGNARRQLLEKASVYSEDDLVSLYRQSVSETIDFDYIDMTTNEIKTTQLTWNTYTRGYNTDFVTRPTAYILPKTEEMELAIERLRIMGAEIQELSPDEVPTSNLQKYVVNSSKVDTSLEQGVYRNTMSVSVENCQDATFENGAYLISTNQIRSNLIIAALEPACKLSYVTFRVIDVADLSVGDTLPYYRYTGEIESKPEPEPIEYTVTFKNYDGSVLTTVTVKEGETATYTGSVPTKPTEGYLVYTFSGWDKSLENVTSNLEVVAQYSVEDTTPAPVEYTVTFKNYDGSVLATVTVKEGETATYTGSVPTKPTEGYLVYTFTGWDKSLENVTSNLEVVAQYSVEDTTPAPAPTKGCGGSIITSIFGTFALLGSVLIIKKRKNK